MIKNIIFRVEIFKEDDQYVAICPELNVSSYGDSIEEARKAISEAINLFLEECEEMGTLKEVLEEAGFTHLLVPEEKWITNEPVSFEKINLLEALSV
ncbi:type II toxin-antitoxin system HicB family antitoxin [candidate division KSB1 bacterium]|nr:type II toxin-antitoxin system HicB family antitoxin [candidate division KSB1 bacterium]